MDITWIGNGAMGNREGVDDSSLMRASIGCASMKLTLWESARNQCVSRALEKKLRCADCSFTLRVYVLSI